MFIPVAAKQISDLIIRGHIRPNSSVVEMGNQTYSVDGDAIKNLILNFKTNLNVIKGHNIDFPGLDDLAKKRPAKTPKETGVPHIAELFKALGFSSYTSIDINSDLDSLVMDLNRNIKDDYDYKETFDFLTNIGVSEHLINQANFMLNAHNLTKKGGVMMHIVPFLGYTNHGFFNYQPRFFLDLAAANDYEVLGLYLVDRISVVVDLQKSTELLTYFYQHLYSLLNNDYHNGLIMAILRKNSTTPFRQPLQGKYIKDISDMDEKINVYKRQGSGHGYVSKGFFPLPSKIALSIRLKIKILRLLKFVTKLIIKHW